MLKNIWLINTGIFATQLIVLIFTLMLTENLVCAGFSAYVVASITAVVMVLLRDELVALIAASAAFATYLLFAPDQLLYTIILFVVLFMIAILGAVFQAREKNKIENFFILTLTTIPLGVGFVIGGIILAYRHKQEEREDEEKLLEWLIKDTNDTEELFK